MKNLFYSALILLVTLSSCVKSSLPGRDIELENRLCDTDFNGFYSYINFSPSRIAFIDSKGVEVWQGCCDEYAFIDSSQEWAIYELDESNYVEGFYRDAYGVLCEPNPYMYKNDILFPDEVNSDTLEVVNEILNEELKNASTDTEINDILHKYCKPYRD